MPEPSPDAVEALFQQAADLEPEERGAFLNEQCAGDPDLRAAVEELLDFDTKAQNVPDFMHSPPPLSALCCRLRRSLACRITSAAIASSAGTGKVAWAPSTRPNRTTRGAPSPSR